VPAFQVLDEVLQRCYVGSLYTHRVVVLGPATMAAWQCVRQTWCCMRLALKPTHAATAAAMDCSDWLSGTLQLGQLPDAQEAHQVICNHCVGCPDATVARKACTCGYLCVCWCLHATQSRMHRMHHRMWLVQDIVVSMHQGFATGCLLGV
jgi:hypothetical protein